MNAVKSLAVERVTNTPKKSQGAGIGGLCLNHPQPPPAAYCLLCPHFASGRSHVGSLFPVAWTEEGTPSPLCPAAPLCGGVSSLFLLVLISEETQLQGCGVSDPLVHVVISTCAQTAFGM